MSGPGNYEVRPEMIYDWKIMVEMICGDVLANEVIGNDVTASDDYTIKMITSWE